MNTVLCICTLHSGTALRPKGRFSLTLPRSAGRFIPNLCGTGRRRLHLRVRGTYYGDNYSCLALAIFCSIIMIRTEDLKQNIDIAAFLDIRIKCIDRKCK